MIGWLATCLRELPNEPQVARLLAGRTAEYEDLYAQFHFTRVRLTLDRLAAYYIRRVTDASMSGTWE